MTSYDRRSLESAILADVANGLRFTIHEADIAYTLGLTLAETSLPNVDVAMQTFLAENGIAVDYYAEPKTYVFSRSAQD